VEIVSGELRRRKWKRKRRRIKVIFL